MLTSHASKPAPLALPVLLAALVAGFATPRAAAAEPTRATLLLAPAAMPGMVGETALAAAPAARRSETGTFWLGATIGLDFADGFTGYAIHPQVAYALTSLGRSVHLDLAGHFGITLGGATGYSGRYLEVVPALRLRCDLGSGIAFYGDMGLGIFSLYTSLDNNLGNDTIIGALLRFPLGLRFALGPGVDFVFEPAGFNIYFNSNGNKFHYSLLAGILFKL